MRTILNGRHLWILLVVMIIMAFGCRPAEIEPPSDIPALALEQVQSTPESLQSTATEEPVTQKTETPDVPVPTQESVSTEPKPSPSPRPEQDEGNVDGSTRYRVVFVEADDVLNVRSGPGVGNDIVGALAPGASDLRATGESEEVSGSTWLRITDGDVVGWVNGRFLTEQLESEAFCRARQVSTLASSLTEAVAARDGALLAELVDPRGGLRINRHWWNPTVYVAQEDVAQQFSSSASYHWGFADGTGDSIEGSFGEIILPLLDKNLVPATEFGCDEIIHGGTAGFIKLPAPYEGIHFISLHRAPDSDGFELDWGTWVAGIERRQGKYYVSFLVHYEWEI